MPPPVAGLVPRIVVVAMVDLRSAKCRFCGNIWQLEPETKAYAVVEDTLRIVVPLGHAWRIATTAQCERMRWREDAASSGPRAGATGTGAGRSIRAAWPRAEQLGFYAERFDTVEVNGTFYRLIEADTFRRWREQTPAGFVFACKGSRYLTHMKRLKDPEQGVARFFERVEALEDKLGPIVFQLPGRFKPDRERLEEFLARPAAPASLRLRVPRPGLVPA